VKGDFGKRVFGPALVPLGVFAFIGALVFGFSRILLAVTKDGSVVLGILMAGCILFAAGAVAKGGAIKVPQRAALIAFSVMLLGGGVAAGLSIGTREVEAHLEVAATIAAQNTKFDKTELDLPADEPFILEFDNRDAVAHNVAIYKDPATAASQAPAGTLFKGVLFPGPKVAEYEVAEGIPAGVYFFRCDAHPVMNGTARVGGATGPGPGGSPTPAPSAPSPAPSSPAPASPPPTGTPAVALVLIAQNIRFDATELAVPASTLVAINFDNRDTGLPHNFALYRDPAYTDALFKGELITGPAKIRYEFPAPGPGTYFFQCDVHPVPAMRGTFTVR
jgi:plastocyanin